MLEDSEGDQGHDALAVGRYLVDGVPAVGSRDRVDPVHAMGGEVVGTHHPAVCRRVRLEFGGQLSPVELLTVGRRDLL
ncbi:Uncharacterised protein [Mycobacterium tuberculosis]|nr:Uncharacterised protein [Mycobacterium tuberculosis]